MGETAVRELRESLMLFEEMDFSFDFDGSVVLLRNQ